MVTAIGTPATAVLNITDSGSTIPGTITVGTFQFFTPLTNPGGLFEAINNNLLASTVAVDIVPDLSGETGAISPERVHTGLHRDDQTERRAEGRSPEATAPTAPTPSSG